jgi:hypothetical protein
VVGKNGTRNEALRLMPITSTFRFRLFPFRTCGINPGVVAIPPSATAEDKGEPEELDVIDTEVILV